MAEPIAETPDLYCAFPRLSETQVGNLEVHAERRPTQEWDVLFHEGEAGYDFFVVLEELVETVGGRALRLHRRDAVHDLARHLPAARRGRLHPHQVTDCYLGG